jgi:hypothetical protein
MNAGKLPQFKNGPHTPRALVTTTSRGANELTEYVKIQKLVS